ncbi:MAG: hypothetical protein ABIK44_06745, partial [candidate division WOR-3 bacterium]
PSRKSKAVGLFSGGLDSILATKLVTEQGVTVVALHFKLPFPAKGRDITEERLRRIAELVGASLVSVDAGEEYYDIVRSPEYGYTRNLAPCCDCMVFMLRKAKELMKELKADFVFTGEVVGQRSFSQNKRSLRLIEKASGLEGRLLRPLCAKLLEPTIPELTGLVRRERLLDFRGRSRRRQIRLAREYGIMDYPIPGAGCLLVDRNFAARCRDALAHNQLESRDIEMLKLGRHFRLASGAKVVVGRNETENRQLEGLAGAGDLVCRPVSVVGPVVILRSKKRTKKDTEIAARICARYSDSQPGKTVKVLCGEQELSVKPYKDEEIAAWFVKVAEPEHTPTGKVETEKGSGDAGRDKEPGSSGD